MYDRVSLRNDWQITVYSALIGLDGWVDGWMGGEAKLKIAYNNQKVDKFLRFSIFLDQFQTSRLKWDWFKSILQRRLRFGLQILIKKLIKS